MLWEMSDAKPKPAPTPAANPPADWAVVTGPTPDEKGARIVRFKGDAVQTGEVRPLVPGTPFQGGEEVVRMKPIGDGGVPAFEVESMYTQPVARPARGASGAAAKKGPAQVATEAYRSNWDAIFAETSVLPKGAPN